MEYFALVLFVASSVTHLVASRKKDRKIRAYSKPFIVLAIALWYWFSASDAKAVVLLALFFSWLGDVLLIPDGIGFFTAGGIAFMASHFCFVLCYLPQVSFSAISPALVVLAALIYLGAEVLVFKYLRPHLSKGLFIPMFLYLMINGTMNCFAFYQLLSIPSVATAVVFAGAMLFFSSDSILFYVRFNKETRWESHFPVMLTYILAEFLIVYGLSLIERMGR